MTALVLPNHRKMIAATARKLARIWHAPPLTCDPYIAGLASHERQGDFQLRRRAIQYAAWIAERDKLTRYDPALYQGTYFPASGTVELYHHETSTTQTDCVLVAIPHHDWAPAPIAIGEAPEVEPAPPALIAIEAPRKALPAPQRAPAPFSRAWFKPGANGLTAAQEAARRIMSGSASL